ncbi:MAG TPA: hypothetical protein P5050_07905 [Bacteroidia bacterium]|nr:hypothetical protein [Bacteroidia bacterium]HRS59128.1 hypothetical protein [Bacteroidia bacterium]HRU67424.1 hypothetical protein [Bacteroidia bacterium]
MNNKNDILKSGEWMPCPDAEVFENYLSGKLNDTEYEAFINHIQSCELCREALAGYEAMDENISVLEENNILSDEIDKRLKGGYFSGFKSKRIIYLIAASLALLLTSLLIWQVTDRKEFEVQELANTNDVRPKSVAKPQDSAANQLAFQQTAKGIQNTEAMKVVEIPDVQEQLAAVEENENESGNIAENTAEDVKNLAAEPVLVHKEAKRPEEKEATEKPENRKAEQESIKLALTDSASQSAFYYQSAVLEYNKGNLDKALKNARQAVKFSPKNQEYLYYLALMNYHSGNFREAEQQFNQVIEKNGSNREDAEWYLALTWLKTGKTAEAKVILDKLSSKEGKYRQEAENQLKTLR